MGQPAYQHFRVIAGGEVDALNPVYGCPPGRVWLSVCVWAKDWDEAFDFLRVIGKGEGFWSAGMEEPFDIVEASPRQPARDEPYAYDLRFVPFDASVKFDEDELPLDDPFAEPGRETGGQAYGCEH